MISWLVETLCQFLFGFVKRRALVCFRETVEAKALKVYLQTLLTVRGMVIALVALLFFMQVAVFGLFAFILAVILWSPVSQGMKIYLLLGLSSVLFFIPLALVIYLLSQRFWFRISGAQSLFERLTADSNQPQ